MKNETLKEFAQRILPVVQAAASGETITMDGTTVQPDYLALAFYVGSIYAVKTEPVVEVEYMNVYRYGENGSWHPKPVPPKRHHLVTIKRTTIAGVVQPLEFLP